MKKKYFIFLSYFLLLSGFFSLFIPQQSFAADCSKITTDPTPVKASQRLINLTIQTSGLVQGEYYWPKIDGHFIYGNDPNRPADVNKFQVSENGTIRIENMNWEGFINPPDANQNTFKVKTYIVSILGPKDMADEQCRGSFIVTQEPTTGTGGDKCAIKLSNPDQSPLFTSRSNISLTLTDINFDSTKSPDDTLDIVISKNGTERKSWNNVNVTNELQTPNLKSLGLFEDGNYNLTVGHLKTLFGWGAETFCWAKFSVCSTCPAGTTAAGSGFVPPAPPPPCLEGKDKDGKITREKDKIVECTKLETAVGDIPTDPAGLVSFLFKLVLGLSGGIALILIIVGAYQMMTSQGNPERLQGAKETITSAIVGLLFIIFSFLLLEVIGVDILKIPGFGGNP